jgi:hypothetical protein
MARKPRRRLTRGGSGDALGGFDDLPGTNATGADAKRFVDAVDEGAYAPEVGFPTAFGDVMSVADPVAKVGVLSADFAFACHQNTSSGKKIQ